MTIVQTTNSSIYDADWNMYQQIMNLGPSEEFCILVLVDISLVKFKVYCTLAVNRK
jgi:hypothetical protein